MSKIRCATAMAVGLMAATAASSGRATVLFSADFQADVPGTPPAIVGNVLQNGTTTQVTTTSAGTDPFGVAGNQSMQLIDQDGTGNGYRASIALLPLPSTASDLIIEMDMLYRAPVGGWTVTNIFIGDSVGGALPWFPNANAVQVFPALTSGGVGSVGQPGGFYSQGAVGGGGVVIAADRPFQLKVVTNSAMQTYRTYVDGTLLGWNFGGGTVFDVPTQGTDLINMITFTSEGLGVPSMGDVFVDNIVVTAIPEPASIGLSLLSCCAVVAAKRRYARR